MMRRSTLLSATIALAASACSWTAPASAGWENGQPVFASQRAQVAHELGNVAFDMRLVVKVPNHDRGVIVRRRQVGVPELEQFGFAGGCGAGRQQEKDHPCCRTAVDKDRDKDRDKDWGPCRGTVR